MIKCQHCGAETSNGLALCDLCRQGGATCLEFIPVHFRNLSRWRPGRAGSRPVPASREPVAISNGVGGDKVSRALDEVGNDLTTWARDLHEQRGVPLPEGGGEAEQASAICELLAEHLTSISTTDWAGDLVTDLVRIEDRLAKLTQNVVPGWYAGACRTCGHATHVVPGLTWVVCGSCGTTTYARDHLKVVLDEARMWRAGRKQIAGAIVALLDTEISVPKVADRIRKWESWGWIISTRLLDTDGDETGPKRYQLGAVLDLVTGVAEAPTRPKRRSA